MDVKMVLPLPVVSCRAATLCRRPWCSAVGGDGAVGVLAAQCVLHPT